MHLRLGLAAVIGLVLFVVFLLGGSPQTPAHAQADPPALAVSDAPRGTLGLRAPFTTTTPAVATPTTTGTITPLPCQVGEWNLRAPYPTAIAAAAGVAQDGILYNFGGALPTVALSDSYKYTPATNTWAAIAPLPAPRYGASAVSDGAYIYILGGTDGNGPTNTFWRYDPGQDTYQSLAPAPINVNGAALAYLDGKIYRIGGCTPSGNPCSGSTTNTVDVYTIATNSWTPVAAYPLAKGYITATVLNGYVYTAGGVTTGGAVGASPKTYRYDPATNTWDDAAIADLPGAINDVVSGMLNGRWILAGAGTVSSYAVAWDPGTDAWTLLPFPPLAHDWASGDSTGQALYVVGGLDPNFNWQADTQEYREPACPPTPTVTGTPPTATATATASPTATATQTPTSTATFTATPPGSPSASTTPAGPPPVTPTTTVRPSATAPPAASPTATATPCGITFSDVRPTDYFAAAVHDLACRGVISGYADGTFRPYNLTSRAQMVKIVVLGFGYPIQTPAPDNATFADVPPAQPFWSVIETAAAAHIVSGYDCGGPGEPCDAAHRPYFRPYSLVTRGQLTKIVAGGAGWPVLTPPGATFADVDPAHPFYAFVETAAAHGVISGYNCGAPGEPCGGAPGALYFRPGTDATRGQIAKIVDLALPTAAGPFNPAAGPPR